MVARSPDVPIGTKFGRLTVESLPFRKDKYLYITVACECGNVFDAERASVYKGRSKSCGCLSRELASERSTTHGKRSSPIYAVWNAMQSRCLNPNDRGYHNYGGRGITLQESWRKFEGFYADMGDPAFPGAELERRDNDKGYSKENCYWATRTEQANNKRNSVVYEFRGKSMPLKAWAEELGVGLPTLRSRIYLYQWSVEKSFTTPVNGIPMKEIA